jgi:hypothetical protein
MDAEDAQVRYTWDERQQYRIVSIEASERGVRQWYETVYWADDYNELEYASEVPLHDGNCRITETIYVDTVGSMRYKGVYLPISEGWYTAICTIEDEFGYLDIVANYEISVSGADRFFEVFFDVKEFVNTGYGEDAWRKYVYNNPNTPQKLSKVPGGAVPVVRDGVAYYALRRAKK